VGAIAAGAVGSLITITVALLVRLVSVPREISSHDRRARDREHDLAQWIADRDLRLRRELEETRKALSARKMRASGEYAWSLGLVKERALHEWRDQALNAKRDIATIYDREGWLHARVRWRKPQIVLDQTLETAMTLLDLWRTPPAHDQGRATSIMPIDDPTDRSLARSVRDAPGRLPEYQ
jgi:hypothetical protein